MSTNTFNSVGGKKKMGGRHENKFRNEGKFLDLGTDKKRKKNKFNGSRRKNPHVREKICVIMCVCEDFYSTFILKAVWKKIKYVKSIK